MTCSARQLEQPPLTMSLFMRIAPEIRVSILELCLIVGKINPYPTYYEDDDPFAAAQRKPETSLLTVNKKLNAEASAIFYSKNVWVVNWCDGDGSVVGRRAWSNHIPTDRIWYVQRAEIRDVAFSFTVQDLDSRMLLLATNIGYRNEPTESNSGKRRQHVHALRATALVDICGWKISMLKSFGIRSVTINVKDLFCSEGCCRTDAIEFCCLRPLQGWVSDGAALPSAWHPEIIISGFHDVADMRAARERWETQWEELYSFTKDDEMCLGGFFDAMLAESRKRSNRAMDSLD